MKYAENRKQWGKEVVVNCKVSFYCVISKCTLAFKDYRMLIEGEYSMGFRGDSTPRASLVWWLGEQ